MFYRATNTGQLFTPSLDVSTCMRSVGATVIVAVVVLLGGCSSNSQNQRQEQPAVPGTEYRNAEYMIEGQRIKLADGLAEAETSPGSASRIVTRYFGNELKTDLNDDGREDVVFLLTQQRGGSGTFFYAVAALNTEAGYRGLGRLSTRRSHRSSDDCGESKSPAQERDRGELWRPPARRTYDRATICRQKRVPETRCRNRAMGYRRSGF